MTWTNTRCEQCLPIRRTAILLLFLAVSLRSPQGRGQGKAVLCDDLAPCRDSFAKIQRLAKEGQDRVALQGFLDLYSHYPDPRLCFPIGRMLQRQGQYAQAVQYYRQFLDSGVETDPQQLARTRRFMEEADAALARNTSARSAEPVTPSDLPTPAETNKPREASARSRLPVAGIVLGSSAALLAISGGIALGVGMTRFDTLEQTCKPACSDDQVKPVQQTFQAGYALLGLAGVAAVATAVVLPLELGRLRRKNLSSQTVALRVSVGSLAIGGRL